MIYVIGHKTPDLDSVAAAISYANLKNKLAGTDIYVPATAGEINKETRYILEKLNMIIPEKLSTVEDQEIILVDHNEKSQILDEGKGAEIVGVLDHHKVNFSYDKPIEFNVYPWGSSNTIIAREYFERNVEIDKEMAGLMLAAILSDTVITKSPTCTDMDRETIEKLATKAEIKDWSSFGMEIFKVRSSVSELNEEEIIRYDAKDFQFGVGKFFVGQIETVELNDFKHRKKELLKKMEEIKEENNYHSVIFFITDIIKEGSEFLVVSNEEEKIEEAFDIKMKNNIFYLEGVMSRKKQVIPRLTNVFDK